MTTLSDLIVSYLEQFGIKYVFSVPGGPIGSLYDALVRSEKRGGPRSVLARHENGAAFMADGYARETGRVGVCCATTGPGATNLITGVASAYADYIPLLVITAQTLLPTFGLGEFQESSADATDIVGMFDHCTRYNTLVSHRDQLEPKLCAALTTALQTPKGPAHLSIPVDILRSPAKGQMGFPNLQHLLNEPTSTIDFVALEKLKHRLRKVLSQNLQVVLLIGQGCGGASDEILKFAELINAHIITTPRGKPWVDPYHPLYRGVFGFAGHTSARKTLTEKSAGLVLAVGTNLNAWSTCGWDTILLNNKMVHIHNFTEDFVRSPMACLHVHGTIKTVFNELISQLQSAGYKSELTVKRKNRENAAPTRSSQARPGEKSPYIPRQIDLIAPDGCRSETSSNGIKPQRVIREIIQRFPFETRFLIDNSNSVPWTIHYSFHHRHESYHLSIGFASMGWAIGASVGMALGTPDVPVVCFTGDGCFLMSGQEITVAVREKLPVTFVVLNDQAYGMIKHGHRLSGTEQVDLSIPPVDFSMMAKAVGANAHTILHVEDFEQLNFQSFYRRKGPTLLDVHIDPEEKPPLFMA
jgi:acetolactate synthase-1/2/3 large subunit